MIRSLISVALVIFAMSANAQHRVEVVADDVERVMALCPSKWVRIINGLAYCTGGTAWEAAGKPIQDPPYVVTMEHGAPIAHEIIVDGKQVPCDGHSDYCPGYGPGYSGHGH